MVLSVVVLALLDVPQVAEVHVLDITGRVDQRRKFPVTKLRQGPFASALKKNCIWFIDRIGRETNTVIARGSLSPTCLLLATERVSQVITWAAMKHQSDFSVLHSAEEDSRRR